jgi:hypothetical protein
VPDVPAAGVPASVADPLWSSTSVTPDGSVPLIVYDGVGVPDAWTVKLPGCPTVKVVDEEDVKVGHVELTNAGFVTTRESGADAPLGPEAARDSICGSLAPGVQVAWKLEPSQYVVEVTPML